MLKTASRAVLPAATIAVTACLILDRWSPRLISAGSVLATANGTLHAAGVDKTAWARPLSPAAERCRENPRLEQALH